MPNTKDLQLPDVTVKDKSGISARLQRVGMHGISKEIKIVDSQLGIQKTLANFDIEVSLDESDAKGIHMSRLYLLLKNQTYDIASLKNLLEDAIASQQGLSSSALIVLRFPLVVWRPSLLSDNGGDQVYPIKIIARLQGGNFEWQLNFEVTYSSACPCSAALSRQAMAENFGRHFANQPSITVNQVQQWLMAESSAHAIAHNQRSIATCKLRICQETGALPLLNHINRVEESLNTAVQTAVKREDEQEFAAINGENLMFCEDAARRLNQTFQQDKSLADYFIQVRHMESLHAHDAVAKTCKNLSVGFNSLH